MKELSIFVDESGDFGKYDYRSPYYILSFVFHNQENDISSELAELDSKLNYLGLGNVAIHTGPIIRQEEIYSSMDIETRRKIMRTLMAFYRNVNIKYTTLHIEKSMLRMSSRSLLSYRAYCQDLLQIIWIIFFHLIP